MGVLKLTGVLFPKEIIKKKEIWKIQHKQKSQILKHFFSSSSIYISNSSAIDISWAIDVYWENIP